MLASRLQTIYRLAHGGRAYRIDIYLRNWSIRTELQRRAYLYNIENESFPQSELSVPAERRPTNDSNKSGNSGSSSLSMKAMNFTSDQHHDVELYENSSHAESIDRERQTSQSDLLYQKQYCDQIKTIHTDIMRTNGMNVAASVHKSTGSDLSADAMKILCDKNEVIVDRCGTWSKSVRNCSERKASNDAKNVALSASTEPTKIADTMKKPSKMCPFNPLSKCDSCKANKPPKFKTQNTFISRLFLTDILDNI